MVDFAGGTTGAAVSGGILTQVHPSIDDGYRRTQWKMMRDAHEGEERIKGEGETYLPPTQSMYNAGMQASNSPGTLAYNSYIQRAVFHDILRPALEAMVGIMFNRPWAFELPPQLEGLRDSATIEGESLEMLARKMVEQQLLMGRIGLLLDVPTGIPIGEAIPHVVTYAAEAITNWDFIDDGSGERKTSLVVLDESSQELGDKLAWMLVPKYRVLGLSMEIEKVWPGGGKGSSKNVYVSAQAVNASDVSAEDFTVPSLGGIELEHIPFEFVGPRDLARDPDVPPLVGLARIAIAIYRMEADYRQALFMQGQDTLVRIGMTAPSSAVLGQGPQLMGALGVIDLPAGGDAKFIGVDAAGLDHLARAIESDKKAAADLGGNFLVQKGAVAEAAEALTIRQAAKTATLSTIARSGAEALTRILRTAAEWKGVDPAKVVVEPNLEFTDPGMTGRDLLAWMQAKQLGAPISSRTIHALMVAAEKTALTFEEEQSEIDTEEPILLPGTPGAPGEERGVNEDENNEPV